MPGEQILYNRPLPGARLNTAHPLARGLVGCWLLNENGGLRAMDLSPYGNHGLLVGFASPPPRPFNGLYLDGLDDYVDVPDALAYTHFANKQTSITIETWVKPSSLTGRRMAAAVGEWQTWLEFNNSEAGKWDFIVTNLAGASYDVISTSNVLLEQWVHVVGTYDQADVKIYINGSLEQSENIGAQTLRDLGDASAIGANGTADIAFFPGLIGEVHVYNRALTAEEIKACYLSPYQPYGIPMFL